MPKRVLCKFFAHGACLKGEYCEFSHSWSDPPNNVCTFYQRGVCAYGSRCRYEHVKASSAQPSGSSSVENSQQPLHFVPAPHLQVTSPRGVSSLPSSPLEPLPSSTSLLSQSKPAWNQDPESHDFLEDYNLGEPSSVQPADRPICPFAAAGNCPKGEKCPHIHGDLCPTCGKHCLHPFRPMERDEHMKMCEKKQKDLEALKYSQEIECSVCLERVLLKPTPAERKFGILSECDHPFCISCIRNWRSSSPATGMDMNSALRTCPICRKLSYFVIPSVIWYCSKEEKKDIVDSYKAKLRSIDCRHFNFGNGNCPFGTSCFYKHTVKSGSYAWKYHCPPPPPPRSNNIDQDSMFSNIFRELASFIEIAEELEELEENVEPEDLQFEGLEPWQWDFFHAQMGYDSDELGYYDSDEEEETYL